MMAVATLYSMSVFYFSVFFFSMSRWESFDRLLFIKCICTFFVVAKVSYFKKRLRQTGGSAGGENQLPFIFQSSQGKQKWNRIKPEYRCCYVTVTFSAARCGRAVINWSERTMKSEDPANTFTNPSAPGQDFVDVVIGC